MPRFEFSSWEKFVEWLVTQKSKYGRSYKLYVTEDQEVVAVPVTSTRPLEYGYYNFDYEINEETLKKGFEKLLDELIRLRFDIFRVKSVAWNPEREPRIKLEEEE